MEKMAVDTRDLDYHRHGEHQHKALVVQPRTTLYCSTWYHEDPRRRFDAEFFGVSMHLSAYERAFFHKQFHHMQVDEWSRKRLHASDSFSAVASKDFYNFAIMSVGEKVKGIIVRIPALRYARNFNFVASEDIELRVSNLPHDLIKGPKTEDMVLSEILEDTANWYANIPEEKMQ